MDPNQQSEPTATPNTVPPQPPVPTPSAPGAAPVPATPAPATPQPVPAPGVPSAAPVPPADPAAPGVPPAPAATVSGGAQPPLPPTSSGSSKKGLLIKILALVVGILVIVALFFVVTGFLNASKYKEETQVGTDFITGVQKGDAQLVEKTVDPNIAKLASESQRIFGGDPAIKEEFYNAFIESDDVQGQVGSGTPKRVKAMGGEVDGKKYAILIYEVGSSHTTVLEYYVNDKPYVLAVQSGKKEPTKEEVKEAMELSKTMVDVIMQQLEAEAAALEESGEFEAQSAKPSIDSLFGGSSQSE